MRNQTPKQQGEGFIKIRRAAQEISIMRLIGDLSEVEVARRIGRAQANRQILMSW